MSRAGSDARGVWGTTRDLHLQVAAHTKEMRALREAPEVLNFLAYAKSRDDARARRPAASRRGAPAGPTPAPRRRRTPRPPPRPRPPRARTRPAPHPDGRSRRGDAGRPARGRLVEVGKPYRAGGGSAVADVARDADLFPRRVPAGAKEPTTSDASAPPRPNRRRARHRRRRRRRRSAREFLAGAGCDRGVFAAARRTSEEGSSSEDEDEEEGTRAF